jgi:hypothetical protein
MADLPSAEVLGGEVPFQPRALPAPVRRTVGRSLPEEARSSRYRPPALIARRARRVLLLAEDALARQGSLGGVDVREEGPTAPLAAHDRLPSRMSRGACRREFVGDECPFGGAKRVQLDYVGQKRSPTSPMPRLRTPRTD